ncbi:Pre-mRNA splicing factor PRP21 like protein-domain-containing protein [Russula earlei]|uniref:Pre-mRNA splicing factor PRP21 like protein-domain-containing protein n=1 Tax=Russula earlei TaxID=71964 RepID=A0ACC0UAK3_9AGAM|nr:Pre-mRNA splicing factor PRP21 like protein-domain-containing protein [Russula earlei]
MQTATSTPPPLNGVDVNGNGHSNDSGFAGTLKFSTGLILPPPDVKSTIDRTIVHMNRSSDPLQFEVKLRESRRTDPAFSFLNPADPYHAYYRNRQEAAMRGEVLEGVPTDAEGKSGEAGEGKITEDYGRPPPPTEFILDMPNISAVDLDIMKLTALFTARQGHSFLANLSVKEGRNYQFDFLKPTHSLFGYFNRLIEQYTKVLMPTSETLEELKKRADNGAKWKMLADAQAHAKWERTRLEQEKKREDDREAERTAFAEIDWHDYAIVQTIEFTAADAAAELPPPMSVQEVENMTLAQKRMAAMVMETTVEDVEAHRARQAAAEAEAAAAVSSAGGAAETADDDVMMEESDDEDAEASERKKKEEEERQKELDRARAIQASSLEAGAPMKIRTDYVPKLGAKSKVALATCTICGQQIPVNELQEHMRIELLDPRWKSQRDALEARKAQASELQRGANVVSSLKNLARTRVDIFGTETDEERRKREEEEEREKRKEREKVVWDGHTATKAGTLDKYSTNVNFDEQIAAIHRAKGLGPQESNAIGPGIGPAAAPPPLASAPPALPIPAKPVDVVSKDPSYTAATVSSGPQPPSMYPTPAPPVMLPPLHYQGLDSAQPFGYQPPPTPVRVSSFNTPPVPPPSAAGTVRPADQMEGDGDDVPPTKRQRVAKLPGGQYYPEQDWIHMHSHPISLQVQLPTDTSKPEWKLDGTIVTIPDLPLNLLVSTLRDRIIAATGSALSAGRLILSYNGKMLTNRNTIASYNLEDEDLLVLSVRDPKKK